jgi:hypothetical protein
MSSRLLSKSVIQIRVISLRFSGGKPVVRQANTGDSFDPRLFFRKIPTGQAKQREKQFSFFGNFGA